MNSLIDRWQGNLNLKIKSNARSFIKGGGEGMQLQEF